MLGYEENIKGDGLIGEYYDNEFLIGTSVDQLEEEIDLYWDADPAENIGLDNFSLKLTGFVRAPSSGEYVFSVKGDDGFHLSIND